MQVSGCTNSGLSAQALLSLLTTPAAEKQGLTTIKGGVPTASAAAKNTVANDAIAAIKSIVAGQSNQSEPLQASASSGPNFDAVNAAYKAQYNSDNTVTYTPLGTSNTITMKADEWNFVADTIPTSAQDLKDHLVDQIKAANPDLIQQYSQWGDEVAVAVKTAELKAANDGTLDVQFLDPRCVSSTESRMSFLRDTNGAICGNGYNSNPINWDAFNSIYGNNSSSDRIYTATSDQFGSYVYSWPKD
jgi:hypothetical protein